MSLSPTIKFDFADLGDSFAPLVARLPRFVGDDRNETVVRFYGNLQKLADDFHADPTEQTFARIQQTISPLVLYGPGYSGKSCLSAAIAKRLVDLFGSQLNSNQIYRMGLAEFCRDFGKAVYARSVEEFLAPFHEPGVILFDDLQKMGGNLHASLELEKLLSQMASKRQFAIFTSRQTVGSIAQLADRLASRLGGGVVLPVNLPGPVGKKEIISLLRDQYQAEIQSDAIDTLCTSPTVSFADITQYFCSTQIQPRRSDSSDESLFSRSAKEKKSAVQNGNAKQRSHLAGDIISLVARHFGLTIDEITGTSRRKKTALARNICIFSIRNKTGLSYQKIGRHFSDRDHSTIMHAFQKISANQDDLEIRKTVEMIDDQLFRQRSDPYSLSMT